MWAIKVQVRCAEHCISCQLHSRLDANLCRVPPTKMPQQLMLFTALVYLVYALNAPAVRQMLSVPTTDTNVVLDWIQPTAALCIVLLALAKLVW